MLPIDNTKTIIPNIDTSIYKVRVAQALSSLTGYEIEIDNAAENINVTDSQIYSYDSEYIITPLNVFNNTNGTVRQDLLFENTAYMKSSSFNNDAVIADQIATRAELEAQGRAMLKERGLTESEARKKLAEKGISEAQVWDYLIKNGYLDEEEIDKGLDNSEVSGQIKSDDYAIESEKNQINAEAADNKSNAYNNEENQIIQNESNYSQNDDIKVSKKKIQDIVISVIMDQNTNLEEKMQILSSKLMEEADKIINAEMEKLNFSNIINSDMFKTAVRITSALYNMFYGFIMITLALIFILCIVNKDNLKYSVNIAAKSVMISGAILSLMSGAVYLLKLYEKVEVDFNKVYFESMFISSCDYFSRVLFIISISIFFAGIIINILMIKNRLIRR